MPDDFRNDELVIIASELRTVKNMITIIEDLVENDIARSRLGKSVSGSWVNHFPHNSNMAMQILTQLHNKVLGH